MELAKDLNNIYQSLQGVWENVYPILIFHVLFILLFSMITGIKLFSASRFDALYRSEKISGLKKFMAKTGLREKFNWTTLIILVTLYLVVFSGIFKLFTSLHIPLVSIKLSATDFYREGRPIDTMAYIAMVSTTMEPEIDEIENTKEHIIASLSNDYDLQYLDREVDKDKTIYYTLVLSFIVALIIIFNSEVEPPRKNKILLRGMLFLLLNIIAIVNIRWWVEQDYEQAFVTKTVFASRMVKSLQYQENKSHVAVRDLKQENGLLSRQKVDSAREEVKKYLERKLNTLQPDGTIWISKCFGKRKLSELKQQ